MAAWDERYREIFGVTGYTRPNDEILAQLIHPDDLLGLWAKVEAALNPATPQPFAAVYRINRCRFRGRQRRLADTHLERQLFRIAQEAAYNAAKHSRGHHIWITLRQIGERGWHVQQLGCQPDPAAPWSATVALLPGRHEYRLVVNGEWRDDPAAKEFVPNPHGSQNTVIEVC